MILVFGVMATGYSRKRIGKDGKPRYTAYYVDIRGRERSAGTYRRKKEADKAWQREESKVAEGRVGDPRRGRQRFRRYVEEEWLPNHVLEPSTRQNYHYFLNRYILDEFGSMRMVEILPAHVREWVTKLQQDGVRPPTIQRLKVILSAIFTTALNDQVTFLHPCKGVKTPTVAPKPRRIITAEQFDALYRALPDAGAQLLVETAIESGLRWGELTELRPRDIDFATRILTVSRAVVELSPRFHPHGGRFWVKAYPKDREYRRFKLSRQIIEKLKAHVDARGLGRDDLLFALREIHVPRPQSGVLPAPESLGLTDANDAGRRYRHGTLSGYSMGRCRCQHCRDAYAVYRARRRANGKDTPRARRTRDTDGHIPRDWFRKQIWYKALDAAELESRIRMHDLRHAHASWLLAGGADLQVVKERLGHATIATTEKYLHTLPNADDTALRALDNIRGRVAGERS